MTQYIPYSLHSHWWLYEFMLFWLTAETPDGFYGLEYIHQLMGPTTVLAKPQQKTDRILTITELTLR